MQDELLARWMQEYGDSILRMCFLYLKDYHLAEDAAQETFLKAARSYGTFEHASSEKTWLTRIAINCCKNIMRTRWFRTPPVSLTEAASESVNPFDTLLQQNSLASAIASLPPKAFACFPSCRYSLYRNRFCQHSLYFKSRTRQSARIARTQSYVSSPRQPRRTS